MIKKVFFLVLFLFIVSLGLFSWGFYAHKRINRLAVFTLPKQMIRFYKSNIDYITEQAVAPDKRRYADAEEAPRHYLDADYYGKSPFDSIPVRWNDAVAKYSEDTLKAYGIVPWRIDQRFKQLVDAFRALDSAKILFYSADLGHYIADACVPLHTTMNHDGQLTNQKGLHGFWESRLPELFADNYNYWVGKAHYIDNPLKEAFRLLKESHCAVDSVLFIEKTLHETFAKDKKYSMEQKGNSLVKVYSYDYSNAYHQQLNGMVERRMRAAILAIGSYWYTAWVDAGQPDLKKLIRKEQSEEEKKQIDKEEKAYKKGTILGRQEGE